MLTQDRANELMAMMKQLIQLAAIQFLIPGEFLQLEAKSEDGKEAFVFDANRKGKIKPGKCTYQERYAVVEILLRLDVDGPPHDNPDGTEVPTPHLHVYREGYGTKWAVPAPIGVFTDTNDLIKTLREFLRHCKVSDVPAIQHRIS